jgi:hypothetical protein
MDKEFVSYEQALSLKELALKKLGVENIGHTFGFYASFYTTATPTLEIEWNDEYDAFEIIISAPLKQQVFRWFREKYNIHGEVFVNDNGTFIYLISRLVPQGRVQSPIKGMFNTYEKAENACIDKLIEIFKQQDNEN